MAVPGEGERVPSEGERVPSEGEIDPSDVDCFPDRVNTHICFIVEYPAGNYRDRHRANHYVKYVYLKLGPHRRLTP